MGDNKKNAAHLSGGGGEKGDTRGVVSVRPRHKPPAPELHKPLQSQSIKAQSQAPDSEHAFRHIQIQPAPPEPATSPVRLLWGEGIRPGDILMPHQPA